MQVYRLLYLLQENYSTNANFASDKFELKVFCQRTNKVLTLASMFMPNYLTDEVPKTENISISFFDSKYWYVP